MGKPIKISYLAEQMIRLSGKLLADIKIEYIGLRAGEKLYEELFHDQEKLMETDYEKLLLAQARSYDKSFWLSQIEALEAACNNNDSANVLRVLKAIVPEYKSGETCKERARGEFSSGKKNPLHVVKQREV
jgi:FlaA1/EpsC-like NDP-sugar epimerase